MNLNSMKLYEEGLIKKIKTPVKEQMVDYLKANGIKVKENSKEESRDG